MSMYSLKRELAEEYERLKAEGNPLKLTIFVANCSQVAMPIRKLNLPKAFPSPLEIESYKPARPRLEVCEEVAEIFRDIWERRDREAEEVEEEPAEDEDLG